MTILLLAIIVCLLVGYFPLVRIMLTKECDRVRRKRPVDQVLADAFAAGQLTQERFGQLMDEVHRSLPSPDAPYPLVQEIREIRGIKDYGESS